MTVDSLLRNSVRWNCNCKWSVPLRVAVVREKSFHSSSWQYSSPWSTSWYIWYSEMRSLMLLAASLNSPSSMPAVSEVSQLAVCRSRSHPLRCTSGGKLSACTWRQTGPGFCWTESALTWSLQGKFLTASDLDSSLHCKPVESVPTPYLWAGCRRLLSWYCLVSSGRSTRCSCPASSTSAPPPPSWRRGLGTRRPPWGTCPGWSRRPPSGC